MAVRVVHVYTLQAGGGIVTTAFPKQTGPATNIHITSNALHI